MNRTLPGAHAIRAMRRLAQKVDEIIPRQQRQSVLLFDHLVSVGEQCWRDGETEFLGGLQIDSQH